MPVFVYRAIDSSSRPLCGTIVADSAREARDRLRDQSFAIEYLEPQEVRKTWTRSFFQSRNRNSAQVGMAIRDLATLLSTGVGLLDGLETIALQYRGRFKASLVALREAVAGGSSLSEAMEFQQEFYDELMIQMVRVGENAGNLDVVLDRIADFRERYLQFKDRITSALIYPVIVITLAISVSIFLMAVVLPMLLENLVASGKTLPWPTRVLKGTSDLLIQHGWWLGLAGVAFVILLNAFVRMKQGKELWHRILFSLPIFGDLAKKQEIARASIVIGTLIENGIVFVDAIETAARASRNLLLKEAFESLAKRVQSGGDIGEALARSGIFPPLVIQIFTVGQQSGEMERMLTRLATNYENQVSSATTRLVAALEPALIVFLAILVGFILFATILPILEAGNVL